MMKYSKALGSIVGGVVGIILVVTGITETAMVPATMQPIVDTLVTLITGAIGTYAAPKNTES